MIQQRLDLAPEVFFVSRIDFGSDLQRSSTPLRNFDCTVRALFGRNAAEKREVAAAVAAELIQFRRETVVNCGQPIHRRHWPTLVRRYGNQRHSRKRAVDRMEIGQIETAMQSSHALRK